MSEEERYTNRQIERLLDAQSTDIKEHIDSKTQPILAQTIKTNGRVTKAEEEIVKTKVWSGRIMGGLAVVGIFITSIVALQVWMVVQILNIPNTVHQAIEDAK